MTSGYFHKESHNQSETKIYLVCSNNDVKLPYKKLRKAVQQILCKRIKQCDWQREFWGQNSRTRTWLWNCLKSILSINWVNLRFLWMQTYMQKISITTQLSWHLIEDLILAFFPFFSGIHSIQGWKATTKHGATRKRKRSKAKKDLDVPGKLRKYNQVCLNTLIWMDSIIHTDV